MRDKEVSRITPGCLNWMTEETVAAWLCLPLISVFRHSLSLYILKSEELHFTVLRYPVPAVQWLGCPEHKAQCHASAAVIRRGGQ